jgi:arginine deiminase
VFVFIDIEGTSVYEFHPSFVNAGFPVWWGDPDVSHGTATLEGGHVLALQL